MDRQIRGAPRSVRPGKLSGQAVYIPSPLSKPWLLIATLQTLVCHQNYSHPGKRTQGSNFLRASFYFFIYFFPDSSPSLFSAYCTVKFQAAGFGSPTSLCPWSLSNFYLILMHGWHRMPYNVDHLYVHARLSGASDSRQQS